VRTSPAVAVADPLRAAHDRLLVEVAALTTSGDWLAYLGAMRRFHRYSATNVLMIMSQRPDASLVAGFGTWKRMGRHVRKGARGIAIWAPMLRRATDAADDAGARLYGFRLAHVFDVADTDGSPLPAPRARARGPASWRARPASVLRGLARCGAPRSWSCR
jgi:antirestriction protein ArdC